jgi:uncharacterized repeat protein (TIGR03803 family)
MNTANRRRWMGGATLAFFAALALPGASPAQTFTDLLNFNVADGAFPQLMSMVQGTDGNLYGSTLNGGNTGCVPPNGCGTLFRVTPSGSLTTLHVFDGDDGAGPGGLVLATDEYFYGSTGSGGAHKVGTIFKMSRQGALKTIYTFSGSDGAGPSALIQATDGNFYGVTVEGGSSTACTGGCGTVFRLSASGTLTTLHNFAYTDGAFPYAALVEGSDGSLYGNTYGGSSENGLCYVGCGSVFKISLSGKFTKLHGFDFTNGANPQSPLIQASDGNFYGTTPVGAYVGFEGCAGGCGTVFRMTPAGNLTVLYSFDFGDGGDPAGGLIQATDGNLYGTACSGGGGDSGIVFQMTLQSVLTTIHYFGGDDGYCPYATMTQATNGILYGTTAGFFLDLDDGSIFSENMGLAPFVTTLPPARKAGASVIILGTDLTGTTQVSFNGSPATFTVVSNTEIATSVPPGATTGTVQVATPNGTLSSNVPFRVLP